MRDPLDAQAVWIAKRLTPKVQRKLGLLMIYTAIPLHIYGFFTSEPFGIFQMSAWAITTTGLAGLIASVPSEKK